MQNLGLTYNSV